MIAEKIEVARGPEIADRAPDNSWSEGAQVKPKAPRIRFLLQNLGRRI